MKRALTPLATSLMACGFIAHIPAASAQQETPAAAESKEAKGAKEARDPAKLETVIVTSQRRKQSLQKTPVAVTAINETKLIEQGIQNTVDLTTQVPSFEASQDGQVYLRGVGTSQTNENAEPTVGAHTDGIYLARPKSVMATGFYDVERVEVLRGPQGTLFGRNSTSGSLNVITRQPGFETEGSASLEAGNYGKLLFGGMVNVPLSKEWAFRAAFQSNSHRGFTSPVNDVAPALDSADAKSARVGLLYKPSERFSALLRLDATNDRGLTEQYGTKRIPGTEGPGAVAAAGPSRPAFVDDRYNGAALEINADAGPGKLTFVTARRVADVNELGETIPTALPTLTRFKDVTNQHELRYVYEGQKLQVVGGLFHYTERNDVDSRFDVGPIYAPLNCCSFEFKLKNVAAAVYGQATYAVMPDLRVTGGLRMTDDKKDSGGIFIGALSADGKLDLAGGGIPVASSGHWKKLNYKVGLEYDVAAQSMLFANVSTGFKSGGANNNRVNANTIYDPEHIRAYEIGWKNRFLDDRVQLNLDLFRYDYTDLQVQRFVPDPLFGFASQTINAGRARSEGLEIEAFWRLSDTDRVDVTLARLDAKYVDFRVEDAPGVFSTYDGKRLAKAPKNAISVGWEHSFDFGNAMLKLRLQTHYESAKYLLYTNEAASLQPSFTKSDVIATWQPDGGRWSLMGYVRNIENREVRTFYTSAGANGSYVNTAPPRTYGLRFEARF
jgi:iron complex outermembrane receptor protein